MRVVSSQSDKDIRRKETEQQMRALVRDLAANILRVVRGGGRAYSLLLQMQESIVAAQEYHAAHDQWPSDLDLTRWLNWEPPIEQDMARWAIDREEARRTIVRGSLQLAASRLVDQPLHVAAGEREISEGVHFLNALRDETLKAARRAKKRKPAKSKQITL
jgi:hypothetical protein